MEPIGWLTSGGRHLLTALTVTAALLASGHAVIWKRDSRSAVSWVVVIWLMPLAYDYPRDSFMGQPSRLSTNREAKLASSLGRVIMNVFLRSSSLSF